MDRHFQEDTIVLLILSHCLTMLKCNVMKLVYLFSPLQLLCPAQQGLIIIVSYGPAPLMWMLGLDTMDYCALLLERHEPHVAHVATDVWCVLLFF